jgi:hypothetical protein
MARRLAAGVGSKHLLVGHVFRPSDVTLEMIVQQNVLFLRRLCITVAPAKMTIDDRMRFSLIL